MATRLTADGELTALDPDTRSAEFEDRPVPSSHRRGLFSVSAVWIGFPMILTCAVFGGLIVYSLGFRLGVAAIVLGNLVLMGYVGLLSVIAGRSGENFALTSTRSFGSVGYRVPATLLATVVIGWFAFQTGLTGSTLHQSLGWNPTVTSVVAGVLYTAVTLLGIRALTVIGMIAAPTFVVLAGVAVTIAAGAPHTRSPLDYNGGTAAATLSFGAAVSLVVATFIDSGTMTADFTRWSRDGRAGFCAAFTAFPIANTIAFLTGGLVVALGGATDPATDGGGFLPLLIRAGGVLIPLAVLFVFINLGSVCAHCLYNGAVSWSQLTAVPMRTLTVVLGVVGTTAAALGVWSHFETWLNLLGVLVPPIGTIIILDQLRRPPAENQPASTPWRVSALIAWAGGAAASLITHQFAPFLSEVVVGIVATAALFLAQRGLGRRQAATRKVAS